MSCQSWFAWTCFLATLVGASADLCANSTSSTLNRKDGGCKKAVSEPENVTWSPTHSSQSTTDYFGDSFTTSDTVHESSTVSVFGSVETYTQEDNIGDCARSCLSEKNCFSIVYGETSETPAEQKCGRQFTEIGRDKLDQVNAMAGIEAYGNSQMEPITSFPNCTSFVYIPSHGIWEMDNGNLSNTENYKNCRILLVTEANSTLLVAANITCYDDCHCSDQLRIHNIRSIESNDQSKNATLCLRPSFNQSVATGALSSDGAYVIVELNIDAKSPVDFSLLVYSKCAGCNETLPCGSDGVCQKLVDEDNSTLTDSKCLRPESYSESCSFIPASIGNTTNDTTANLYSLTTQTSSETPTSSIDYTSNSVSISANPSIGVTNSGVGSTGPGITDASTYSSNLDISTVDPGDSTTDNGLATTGDGLVTTNSAISDTETSITTVGVSSSGAGLSTTSSNSAKTDVDDLTTDLEISTIDTESSNVHRTSTIDLTGTPSVENTHKSIPDSYTTTTNIDSTDNANQNVTGGNKQLAATTNTDQTTQFLSVDNKSTSSPVITSLGVAACNGNASCMDNSNGNSTTSTATTIAGSNKNDNNKTIADNDDSTTTASNIDNNSTVDNSVNISSSSGSTSPPIGIVVGGVVGGLIALLLLVIVIVLLSRQQRKNKINPGNGSIKDSEYVLTSPPPAATSPGATTTATATATVTMTST